MVEETGVEDRPPEEEPQPPGPAPAMPRKIPARIQVAFNLMIQCNEQMRPIVVPDGLGVEVHERELHGAQEAAFVRAVNLIGNWIATGKLTACQWEGEGVV